MNLNLLLSKIVFLFLVVFGLSLFSCSDTIENYYLAVPVLTGLESPDKFSAYWYAGEAEITSYELQQSRYGEIHPGEAVLIFVTEPFSKKKQVKLDDANKAGKDKIDVLKLNMTKKFNTGIYPYSMMLSTFTPVNRKEDGPTLKVTASAQEWCGHSFTQYNLDKNSYDILQYSYFESEGDVKSKLPKATLEDEIWSLIRINPALLPTGNFVINPGTFFGRLRHTPFAQTNATGALVDLENGMMEYQLTFEKPARSLKIQYEKAFPYAIEGWTETYVGGFGNGSKKMSTSAKRKKRIKLDYWNKHDVKDEKLRELLQ